VVRVVYEIGGEGVGTDVVVEIGVVAKGDGILLGLHRRKGGRGNPAILALYILLLPNRTLYVLRPSPPVNEVCI